MRSALARYIMKETKNRQVLLVFLTLLLFPVLYGLLNIPKVIINGAIGSSDFPQDIFGFSVEQLDYLVLLSTLFFTLIIGNACVKYCLNIAQGKTTEIAIAGLRRKAYHHTMGLPLRKVQNFSSPELIQMMTTEIEPIGSFAGDMVALPFRQGGTLITILLFVFIQDFTLGLAAISLYPIQAYIVPIFQRKVNRLIRERYRALQFLSEEIQDSFEGLEEVRSLNLSDRVRDRFDTKSQNLLSIRNAFYRQKYLLKLVNSLIGNFIPFLFYTAGGFFVIQGELTLGALVSIIAAHKDLQAPWMELLNYYQRYNEADHRYRRLLKKIEYKEPRPLAAKKADKTTKLDFRECDFVGRNLYFAYPHSKPLVESTHFRVKANAKVAIVSPVTQGEGVFLKILAGLMTADGGDIFVTNAARSVEPRRLLGTDIMFTGQDSHIFAGTILDNLYLGTDQNFISLEKLMPTLEAVELEKDLIFIGLNKIVPDIKPDTQQRILKLRTAFYEKVHDKYPNALVEFYDHTQFISHMTLAENLIFGTFNAENLTYTNPDITHLLIRVLKAQKCSKETLELGFEIAKSLVEMFTGLSADHSLIEQYCLFDIQELSTFETIINTYPKISREQEQALYGLALRYIPEKHRIVDVPAKIMSTIESLRHKALKMAPKDIARVYIPFDQHHYHPLLSVWENITFGRFHVERLDAQEKATEIINGLTQDTDFKDHLIQIGLHFDAGLSGKFVTATQRQKISIARALISSAQLLIFDKTTANIEHDAHHHIQKYLLSDQNEKGLIWLLHRPSLAKDFDTILVFKEGKIIEQGSYKELTSKTSHFKTLLETEFEEGAA